MTAQLRRTAPALHVVGPAGVGDAAGSSRHAENEGLEQIEAAAHGSRNDVLAAVTRSVAAHTGMFLVLEFVGTRWQIAGKGAEVSEPEQALVTTAVSAGDIASLGWHPLAIEDGELLLVIGDGVLAEGFSSIVVTSRLALRSQRLAQAAANAVTEVEALRSVATRILRARELDEALLAVTNETLGLLDSDIAGVMLRDGDEIVMRACAGNRLADTGNLRMRRGQGLAGHVFATGRAVKVDDYLRNDVISDDFNYLARAEQTRSALGAPLVVDGQVIGVLEVWRRRDSQFGPADIRRLVALADLAAIALDNARQHEISQASQRAVEVAHSALEVQLGKVEHALVGQQALIETLIDGEQLPGIVRIVGERSGCEVVLLDNDFEVLAGTPANPDLQAIREVLRAKRNPPARGGATTWSGLGDRSLAVRMVRTGTEQIGWVCLLTTAVAGDESVELAATQAALTFALHHLEQQAAAKARASMREDLLLNLLKGSMDERRAAIARAKYLQIDLRGQLRIGICTFTGLEAYAHACGWSSPNLDQVRRRLVVKSEEALAEAGLLRLAATTSNGMIALIHSVDGTEIHDVLDRIADELRAELPQCQPVWGVSSPHTNPQQLDRAHTEAGTALQALRQDSGRRVALYEDLGVLALLIAGPQGMPLNEFARDTIGPILAHDAVHGTSLVETLRTYLDQNCNQKDTATKLFVHQKTVKYRLETIEKLTNLNLHEHGDRMRADIAVRANDLQ